MSLTESIKLAGLGLGLDLVGVTSGEAVSVGEREYLRGWLDRDCAGGMPWMHRNFEKRVNPAVLLVGARSVICAAAAYGPLPSQPEPGSSAVVSEAAYGRIADYARLDDYHVWLKERLFALADAISRLAGKRGRFKICVDSAPLAERSLAQRAGLGFIGRNHMLTNERLGSQLLLGEIVTDLPLDPDAAGENLCGDCSRCIQACPTGALRPDGGFDSSRCASYLTIEHKGTIDPALARLMGNRLFGCDECTLACPYTRNAPLRAPGGAPFCRSGRLALKEVLAWSEEDFMKHFGNTPMERCGLDVIKRNAAICLSNAGCQGKNASSGSPGASWP